MLFRRNRVLLGKSQQGGNPPQIEKNDFNLNISRDISTAVGEKEISLETPHAELVEIEKAIQKATAKHNEFLKELGKPLLLSTDFKTSGK